MIRGFYKHFYGSVDTFEESCYPKEKQKEVIDMTNKQMKKCDLKLSGGMKLITLILLLTLICIAIFTIRSFMTKESEFTDNIAGQIEQEMAENQIVLSKSGGRRTVVDFQEPIILAHGKESRLIVHTAQLTETITVSIEGLGGWDWTSIRQEVEYKGEAQYTVDLSQLSEEDFMVNNELKVLTVRIPYAVLSSINIPSDKMKFHDPEKGWAAAKEIKLSLEQNAQLETEASNNMKAKLIDENVIAAANEDAKTVVAELFAATVHSIDPEFSVVVVQ